MDRGRGRPGSADDEDLDYEGDGGRGGGYGYAAGPGRGRARSGASVGLAGGDTPPMGGHDALERGEYPSDSEIPGSDISGFKPLGVGGAGGSGGGGRPQAAVGVRRGEGSASAGSRGGALAAGSGESRGGGGDGGFDVPLGSTAAPGLLGMPPSGVAYDPADFAGLLASAPEDVREVLELIGRYRPHPVELAPPLKPFVPEFLPAVGELDAFIKPPRPDGKPDELGIKKLDEPAPMQSDPTVLDLQLRALSKRSGVEPVTVRAIEHAEKNPREITRWINSIAELHRSKPPPSVHYTRPMPDLDDLMQEWPAGFEALLKEVPLPAADLDLPLTEYARLVCALADIPVYSSASAPGAGGAAAGGGAAGVGSGSAGGAAPGPLIQSLHVLFSLYAEFKGNQHFARMGAGSPESLGGVAGALHLDDSGESESKA